MMKFFRKYMKHLLVTFMSLLLVVWLGGAALTNLLRRDPTGGDQVRATSFGQEVRVKDMWPIRNELDTLANLLPGWGTQVPWGYTLISLGFTEPNVWRLYTGRVRTEPLTEDEWYMLTTEAKKNGPHVPAEAVDRFKRDHGITPEQIQALRARHRRSLDEIDRALHAFLQVQERALLACQSVQVSEADIQHFVRQTSQRARVSIVTVETAKFVDASYEPSEEELNAQFEEYKNTASRPASGLEFGYQLPEAVQVEYIKVRAEALVDRQPISETDPATFEYWQAHQDEFTRPTTQPEKPDDPRRPPKREKGEPYGSFTEARRDVVAKLKRDAAEEEALRIARELIAQLARPWADAATTQPGNYKQPPETETGEDVYPKLIERFRRRYAGESVFRHVRTPLLDRRSLSQDQEIAGVTAMAGTRQQIPMWLAAFLVAGLEAQPEDEPSHARYFRNVYETCAVPFVDPDGNAYVFRTVAARPQQAPAEMGPLRERLIADLRLKRAHAEAEQRARALMARVGEGDLEEAFRSDAELFELLGEQALKHPPPFTRKRVTSRPGWPVSLHSDYVRGFYDPDLVEACFSLAGRTTTQPAPVLVHEQRRPQRWLVVQLREVQPVTQAEYERQRGVAIEYCRAQRQVEVLSNWFEPDQIKARIGWVDAFARREAEGAKPAPPDEG